MAKERRIADRRKVQTPTEPERRVAQQRVSERRVGVAERRAE